MEDSKESIQQQEGDQAPPEHVNLKVMDSAGNATQFKIKTHTALKKLMTTYCERSGLDMQSVRFTFDGCGG
jgi:small ubiquitin-related modifier